MKRILNIFSFGLLFALLISCGSSKELTRTINNDDPEEGPRQRLELANEYYEKGDYYKAIQLYEIVINENIMVNDLEQVYFRYANAHFAQYDYSTASTLYDSFYQAYPDSKNAETAYFYKALSTYNMAEDDYRLDQSSMITAMKQLQDYLITYPEGEFSEDAQQKVEEIRVANQRKELSVGELYAKIGEYKAAIVEFNRFIEDYPSSQLVEKAYFEMLQSRFELAKKSVESKKKERFELVLEHYGYFMDDYSSGTYVQQAREIRKQAEESLKQL